MKKTAWFGALIILWLSISGAAFAQTASSTSSGTSCPQGSFWSGSACVTPQQGCAQSGGVWNGSTCQLSSTSQTPPPPPPSALQQTSPNQPPIPPAGGASSTPSGTLCSQGSFWNGSTCMNQQQGCAQNGGSWNGSFCQMGNASSSMMPGNQPNSMPPKPPMQPGFNPQNDSTTMPQFMNNGGQFSRGDDHRDMHQSDDQQQQFEEQAQKQQSDMMARQAKRMAKEFASELKRYQRIAKRAAAQHLALPPACTDAAQQAQSVITAMGDVSTPDDFSTIMQQSQDIHEMLSECQRMGQQILSAPSMMKMIKKFLPILARKGVDVSSIQDEFDSYITPAYAAITSGSASADDIQAFFDTADDIRSQMEEAMSEINLNMPGIFKAMDENQKGHSFNVPGASKAPPAATSTATSTSASGIPRTTTQVASAYQAFVKLMAKLRMSFHR